MEWMTETEKKIPIVYNVDVLVCGGGVAGVAAAICAALALRENITPRKLDPSLIQETLVQQGMVLAE